MIVVGGERHWLPQAEELSPASLAVSRTYDGASVTFR
jgi:hypothetical protein